MTTPDNVVRVTTASLPADVQRQLALALQTVFAAGNVQVSTASHLEPAIQVRIDCAMALWRTTFHDAAVTYVNQRATSPATSAVSGTMIQPPTVLRRFYQAHAAIVEFHPRRLGLQAVVNDADCPTLESNFSLRHADGFLEQFAEFIVNAQTIQDTARALRQRQPMVIEELQCTCKHRDGFELKWLDDAQDRYVNQFFNPDGSPASGIEIMHNG